MEATQKPSAEEDITVSPAANAYATQFMNELNELAYEACMTLGKFGGMVEKPDDAIALVTHATLRQAAMTAVSLAKARDREPNIEIWRHATDMAWQYAMDAML